MSRDSFFRLYAAEESYFSAKVRPAFRYKRAPYVELLPTTRVYRDVLRPRTGLAMIPVVVTPEDDTWQDSSDILDALEARFPDPPLYPTTPVQRFVAHLVELYADEFLILPGLHYRWSFPESEAKARADFASLMGDAARSGKFADQVKMFTHMVGVRPETVPHIEAHTLELLDVLDAHFAEHGYVLGGRPSLADYGLIGPFYAHLYLDAVPSRLLRERALRVCHWIQRVNHPDPDDPGEWLADDALAPGVRRLLALIGRDAVPFVLACVEAFERWVDESRPPVGEVLPRIVGMHESRIGPVTIERVTVSYTLWMVQRVLGAFAALSPGGQAAVRGALAGTGCEALLDYRPSHRVGRHPFLLTLDA